MPRRSLLAQGDVAIVDFSSGEPALLCDLGIGGMGLQTFTLSPTAGHHTFWSVSLPDGMGQVQGSGTVTWAKEGGGFGLRFDALDNHSSAALGAWLARENDQRGSPDSELVPQVPLIAADLLDHLAEEIYDQKLSPTAALELIVHRVGTLMGASGAALATESGGTLICRASYGQAPEVGTEVDPHRGVTGECVRSGQLVRCDDTENDPRVNAAVCRTLQVRCVVVVPVVVEGKVVGIIEAFSSSPAAFEESAIELLRSAAELMFRVMTSNAAPLQPETPPRLEAPPDRRPELASPAKGEERELVAAISEAASPQSTQQMKLEDAELKQMARSETLPFISHAGERLRAYRALAIAAIIMVLLGIAGYVLHARLHSGSERRNALFSRSVALPPPSTVRTKRPSSPGGHGGNSNFRTAGLLS